MSAFPLGGPLKFRRKTLEIMCSVTTTSEVTIMLWFCSEPHHRSNQHSLMSDGLIKEEEEKDSWFRPGAAECTKGKLKDVVLSVF